MIKRNQIVPVFINIPQRALAGVNPAGNLRWIKSIFKKKIF